MRTRLPLLLLVLIAAPVLAHTDEAAHSHVSGFWAGAVHPWTGADHLAAMLAVGLWSALALRQPLRAPLAFAASLLAGALLAMLSGWAQPAVEAGITVSLAVLGLLVALKVGLPPAIGAATAALLAFSHGSAHGLELQGLAALAGMVASTLVLHGLGLALGWKLRSAPRLAHGLLGAGVAAIALTRVL
ncbi:HupE/UreJ family protein [Pelomonas sp. SE-A7]|uniref:HupE/UreJ family protein n=1 Tax=Pelomonas sp. SE-A7 TaxID=3054953 RepID=UPI00259C7035|nr:HupE/UreJ family protein [Pelomonas sp. SE-A7]MDM4766180.1 HupE/UreJ family protein [Pelomonas sp. SE-A7]